MEYTVYVETDGYDEVVFRGNTSAREFIASWLAEGRVLAGMNVNVWDITDPIHALVTSGQAVDARKLANTDVPLDRLLDHPAGTGDSRTSSRPVRRSGWVPRSARAA